MNTRYSLCVALILISVCFQAQVSAQEDGERIPGGEYRKLSSQFLSEERTLVVIFPDQYESSTVSFPVLYMLDASQRRCSQAMSVMNELLSTGKIPPMILVGVVNTKGNRNRDMHPTQVAGRAGSGGADNFISFLDRELKPFVNKNYRATDESSIIGFSNSGYFVVYCLLRNPELFDHYIASSPMLGYGRELILSSTADLLESRRSFDKSLFIIYGGKDHYEHALNTTPDFDELLRSNMPKEFRYVSVFLADEGHVPGSTIERGLEWTYSADQHEAR